MAGSTFLYQDKPGDVSSDSQHLMQQPNRIAVILGHDLLENWLEMKGENRIPTKDW